ncbi:MAG: HlyD family type I secretion periplasmic adaptor subunit [Tabrizicola sp.]|jgi:HlyD family secretion protein|nr:HlyD family type I secretion periplasmic adaptor subunit [Tabrizicola sp.]
MSDRLSMRGPVLLGLAAVVVLVFGFGSWAVTARLAGAIVVPGRFETDQTRVPVQHPDGGVVAALHVAEGQAVAAGTVLLSLDGSALRTELAILENRIGALSARAARLTAERSGANALTVPADLGALAATLPDVAGQIDGQMALFKARQATLSELKAQLARRIEQVEAQALGLGAQRQAAEDELALVQADLGDQQDLFGQGLSTRARVLVLEREAAQLAGDVAALDASLAAARGQVTEIEIQIGSLILRQREEAEAELRALEPELHELEEQRRAVLDRIAQLDLRAPVAGTVMGLRVAAPGAVLRAADPALTLVPIDAPLVATARIAPSDGDRVWQGQSVELRVDPSTEDAVDHVAGSVLQVSPDTLTDPVTGAEHYLVRVGLLPGEAERLAPATLGAGMPVQVLLQTGQRTPLAYLWEPFGRYFSRALREG